MQRLVDRNKYGPGTWKREGGGRRSEALTGVNGAHVASSVSYKKKTVMVLSPSASTILQLQLIVAVAPAVELEGDSESQTALLEFSAIDLLISSSSSPSRMRREPNVCNRLIKMF